ncbi:hypothetical protein ACJ7V3_05765 [Halomonas elongata]|uniref:hypothetical protein n=1 Tax=Halomonas elongata TaxID=2746 RepID=UPI0038D3D2D6
MKEILEFLESGSIGWAFVVLILIWVTQLDILKIFDMRSSSKDKKIDGLEDALASDHLDDVFKDLMKERLAELVFERHFGIFTDEEKRNVLIAIHNADPRKANWTVLRRAHPYIHVLEDGGVDVVITRGNKIERFFVKGVTLLIGAYAVLLFLLGLVNQWVEGQGIIQFGALGLAVLALALFFSSIDWPYQAAATVKGVLSKRGIKRV